MKMNMTVKQAKKLGWSVGRGAYAGTTDDNINRWYLARDSSDVVDRRGRGYPTRKAALAGLAEFLSMQHVED